MNRPSFTRTLSVVALGASLAGPAAAQTYPDKPIRVIVPTAPGGGYDFVGRLLVDKMGAALGQPLVIENRTGAGTLVGTQAAAAAAPDGYTLVVGGLANIAFVHGLYAKPQYGPDDFVPVGLAGSITYTLIGRSDLKQASLKELLDYARANPGKLNIATGGGGSGQHLAVVLLKRLAKVDMLEVPFKGAQMVYPEIMGGRVDLFFDNTTTAKPFIDNGRVKALATSGSRRDTLLPNVPTVREAGVEGMVLDSWIGLFAPAKTPPAALARLRTAMQKALEDPEAKKRLETGGWQTLAVSVADTPAFVKADADKWITFLRQAGIKAE